jgi:hypothetical protein
MTLLNSVRNLSEPMAKKQLVLEPEKWVEKEFPLLPYINNAITGKIIRDNQNIVLFHFDCEKCKQLIEKIQDTSGYVFIAVPSEKNNVSLFSVSEYVSLPDNHEWWIETPVVLSLENGIVKRMSRKGED